VIIDGVDISETILKTEFENIDIVSSDTDLAGCEIELTSRDNREYILKNAIDKVRDNYDYIFIDCPPSLGMLTINSLTAVDSVLIPIQCEYYALEGVSQLMGTIKLVKSRLNPELDIQGVVLSMFDGRANLSIQVVEEVKKYFRGSVYTTLIPRNVRLAEAPSHGMPVHYYDSKCRGAVAYMELAEEFIDLEEDII
jgi:chromosome partitioning protein